MYVTNIYVEEIDYTNMPYMSILIGTPIRNGWETLQWISSNAKQKVQFLFTFNAFRVLSCVWTAAHLRWWSFVLTKRNGAHGFKLVKPKVDQRFLGVFHHSSSLFRQVIFCIWINLNTPPKTNIEPENHPFEKENHLPNLHFGVPAVSFQGCNLDFEKEPDFDGDKLVDVATELQPCLHVDTQELEADSFT